MRSNHQRHCSGITLMELMTVVVIVGILAMVAIPSLGRMIQRGYRREAIDILMTIYHGERAYYFTKSPPDKRSYSGSQGANPDGTTGSWDRLFMDDPNVGSIPVGFFIEAVTGTGAAATFTARARQRASNNTMTVQFQNNQGQNEQATWCGTGTSVPPTNQTGDSCDTQGYWPLP